MRKTLLLLAVTALPASAMAAASSYTVDPAHTFPHSRSAISAFPPCTGVSTPPRAS